MAQVTLREYLQGIEDALGSGRVEDAAKQCQHVLVQFPESLEVQRLLGEVYLAQGHMEEAQQALDWILTNDPENVIAYCDRALISERTSDFDTALDCYQQAYELSRGNRHIRQQFNMLSSKVGQQGFMFSRAGLARLYMRGGLLSQAVQEWQAVLAVNPDRLDARTGLLETYWREERYDEAEQVALQVLQDVPGCIKSLLILAHVTSPKNMQQAKEYVQRAETLDPDLSMAQELFEDMLMSQPGHPFLKLLSKSPALVETKQATSTSVSPPAATPVFAQVPVSDALSNGATVSNNPFEWSSLNTWNDSLNTLAPDMHPQQATPDSSTLPTWSYDTFANNDNSAWTMPEQEEQEPPAFQALDGFQFDPWAVPSSDKALPSSEQQEQAAWNGNMSHLSELDADSGWQQEHTQTEGVDPAWMSAAQENSTSPAPPSWLNMLTPDEQNASSQSGAASALEQKQPSAEIATPPATQQLPEAVEVLPEEEQVDTAWRETLQTSLNEPETPALQADDDEEFSFGPEWLKSIGATEIHDEANEQPAQSATPASTTVTPPVSSTEAGTIAEPSQDIHPYTSPEPAPIAVEQPSYDAYAWSDALQSSIAEPQQDTYDWSQFLSPEVRAQEPEQPEQALVNTLEGLEDTLRAQGFVPLEPKSLSSIAQSQGQELSGDEPNIEIPTVNPIPPDSADESLSHATPVDDNQRFAVPQQPNEYVQNEETYQNPYYDASTLSSALAQLGNLASPYTQSTQELLSPAAHETAMSEVSDEEPSWMANLRSVPAPAPVQEAAYGEWSETQPSDAAQIEVPTRLTFDQEPLQQHYAVPQEQSHSLPNYVEPSPTIPTFEPNYTQQHADVPVVPFAPAARSDAFFDSELEMTMKRPAVRLQAVTQPQHVNTPSASQGSNRNSEGRSVSSTGRGTSYSFQERLIKGYQHQMVGDYDEAMQEYRVIVKSAPNLLDDVISNVRALLKLAPNYSAGYRVLGDAYMRQGEYLQAMESYNKALTMAKKAKV